MSWKPLFSRSLGAAADRLHFAAHSHHLWPDTSFEAHDRAWVDAAEYADLKWERVFGEIWPSVQGHIARVLGLSRPDSIALAPNVHEFLVRLVSCIDARPIRVLTSGSEFHSFERQSQRLEECGDMVVERVPTEPWTTFAD
ncbi:MAG: class V aminotransferase, partial [Planctomycetota bacterium]|nr:class V aminotransferase [Planctomycetota bacterium]